MMNAQEMEHHAALQVASMMAAAARTAPKTRGMDNIVVVCVDDEPTRQRLVDKMKELAQRNGRPGLERDAGNIANAPAILVIGVRTQAATLNCGYCGHKDCKSLEAAHGICAFNSMDLGIAACSAANAASLFHLDNRLMYSIGLACMELGLLGSECRQALGIPLSVTGKNPFFDRK